MRFLLNLKKKDLAGKTCLLRIDLNIQDTDLKNVRVSQRFSPRKSANAPLRIEAVLPTINFLLKSGAKVVLLSHRGRPQLVESEKLKVKSYSLKPFVKIFESLLKEKVEFVGFDLDSLNLNWRIEMLKIQSAINIGDIAGQKNKKAVKIFLVENLRFFEGEEKNDAKFAKELASFGDIYINDAFAVSHRVDASVAAITKYIPSYAGLLLEKEIKNLNKAIKSPGHPFVVIMGGAKISDKIGLIENFIKVRRQKSKVDSFLIGGGVANNFLKAQGLPIGKSLFDNKSVEFAKKLFRSRVNFQYGRNNDFPADLRGLKRGLTRKKIILPVDYVVENRKILDIGPNTVKTYFDIIKKAKTIIWNGPMGMLEKPKFRKGSEGIAEAVIESASRRKAFSIIGGGETAFLFNDKRFAIGDKRLFISTGGGAMLEYLSGKKLPGIEALNTNMHKFDHKFHK